MKGLLIKEWYSLAGMRNFKATLLFAIGTLGFAFLDGMSGILLMLPMIAAMLPRAVLACDENSKWQQLSLALPYSRKDIVSSKYILALMLGFGSALAISIFYTIANLCKGGFDPNDLTFMFFAGLAVGLLIPSVATPIELKYGTENGKVFTMIWGGLLGCSGGLLVNIAGKDGIAKLAGSGSIAYLPLIAAAAALVIFSVSWAISIKVFEKREF
ncbi:MAG: ABC-2 transporter permease [Oscillospiraceae bacterium]|nr:ABC-2 transporter permease [Oscillospiraceae bacterium]